MDSLRCAAAFVLAVLAVAAPATAAAQPTYAQQLAAAGRQLTASLGGLGEVAGMSIQYPVKPDSAHRAAVRLAAVRGTLQGVATKLVAMHPPAAVAAQHALLAKAVSQLAQQVSPVLAQLRAGYLVAAGGLPGLPAAAKVGRALSALQKRGYRIG